MPLLVGIDEAGYGPALGPLVLGATIWNIDQARVDADLWDVLGDCVTRKRSADEWRLAVNDSKSVYDRKKGIHTLERAVLAFAAAAGLSTGTFADLLESLGERPGELSSLPWYRELGLPLPLDRVRSKFEAVGKRLAECFKSTGLQCSGMRARLLSEDCYNRRIVATRNKSSVVSEHVLRLILEAGTLAGDQDLIVRVDRLGGRANYERLLMDAFPERHLHVLEVTEERSAYRLGSARSDWVIEFIVDGDQRQLPIALASMLAKYLREVVMRSFNAWWQKRVPGVKPTAGYYTDAQRFLRDVEPALPGAGVPRESFVRSR